MRRWRATPVVDVAVLLALLLLQAAVLDRDAGVFTSDEGVYALAAVAVADGDWHVGDRFLDTGPDGALTALANVETADGRVYPYVGHPAWVVLLAAGERAAGTAGLYAVPFLAGLAVPLTAWWCAAALDPRWRRAAFWAAAASPAVVSNSHVLWAHSASAAAAGVALGAALRWRASGRRRWLALLAAAAAAGPLVRREDLLLAAAGVAALGGLALLRRERAAVPAAVAWGGGAAAGFVVDRLLVRAVTGGRELVASVSVDTFDGTWVEGRFTAARNDLLVHPLATSDGAARLLLVLVAAAAVGGACALLRRRADLAAAASVVAVAAAAGAWAADGDAAVTGLLAAWPVGAAGAVGLAVVARSRPWVPALAGLFLVAVCLTNYPRGGGLMWGGRFFSPATVALAVGAAALLHDRLPSGRPQRLGFGALAALLAVAFGHATTAMQAGVDGSAAAESTVASSGADVVLSGNRFLPNAAWRLYDDVDWIVADDRSGRSLAGALDALADAGVARVHVAGVPRADLEAAGARVVDDSGPLLVAEP